MQRLLLKFGAGRLAGQTMPFDDSPVTFGRDASQTITLESPYASREHGELRFEDDHWGLVNHSPNGTEVNGKRVTKGPRRLKEGDRVGLGGEVWFVAAFGDQLAETRDAEPDPAEEREPEEEQTVDSEIAEAKRRSRIWIGIGIYLAIMAVVFVVFISLSGGDTEAPAKGMLSDEQIAEEIRRPIERPADPREASRYLKMANASYRRTSADPDALYKTYRYYRLALAYSRETTFDMIEQRRFDTVEQQLIDAVTKQYREAYALLRSKQWAEAEQAFRKLSRMYPNYESRIYRNVQQQLKVAMQNRPGR